MDLAVTPSGFQTTAIAGYGNQGEVLLGTWQGEPSTLHQVITGTVPATRIEQRLRRLENLHSEHVARVLHVQRNERGFSVIREHISGPTLTTLRAASRGLRMSDGWRLLADLTHALKDLHSHGIVHGDISPQNIIVSDQGDRGRAIVIDVGTESEWEMGTEGFRAPEVDRGMSPSASSDVWAAARVATWAVSNDHQIAFAALLQEALAVESKNRPNASDLHEYAIEQASQRIPLPNERDLAVGHLRAQSSMDFTAQAPQRGRRKRVEKGTRTMIKSWHAGIVIALIAAGSYSVAAYMGNPPLAGYMVAEVLSKQEPVEGIDLVIRQLTLQRDEALRSGDLELLGQVSIPDSPAAQFDKELVGNFKGSAPEGLRTQVTVLQRSELSDRVMVHLELQQESFVWKGGGRHGIQVNSLPPRCVEMDLRQYEGQLRVYRTSACAASEISGNKNSYPASTSAVGTTL